MKHYRVLNLGAGVQSTAIFLMLADGELPAVDFAVFADVGDEPEFVYDHLRYLIGLNVMPVHICSQGRLGDDLICGQNSSGGGGGRFVSIPAHLSADDDGQATAIGRRQSRVRKTLPKAYLGRRRFWMYDRTWSCQIFLKISSLYIIVVAICF